MDLGSLIETHGYWVLALGCLLEGETVLLLAGFAAHRGYLNPAAVVAVAAAAGFLGDQAYFWLGRTRGAQVLARWPSLSLHAARLQRLLARWRAAVVVGMRFAYGLRVAGPLLIGMSPMPAWQFAGFNALGAVLWALVVGAVGWFFGSAAEAMLGKARHLEGWLLLGLLVAGLALSWVRKRRQV